MNIALFTFGIFIMFASVVGCSAIRGGLGHFKQWALTNGTIGWIVYGGACGLLVLVLTWPWSY